MPEANRSLNVERQYSNLEFERLTAGRFPECMEDKWFVYYEEPWLSLHRSWTGHCVFRVRFALSGNGVSVTETIVNRDTSQYTRSDDGHDVLRVCRLMDQWAGRVTSS